MNLSRNRGFAPLRYAHSPQDICNKVTVRGIETAKSQKTVSRAKDEPSFTTNRPVETRRKGKEGPVGKKASPGASRPFQAIHGPLKRKNQKTVRQSNKETRRGNEQEQQALSDMQDVKEDIRTQRYSSICNILNNFNTT